MSKRKQKGSECKYKKLEMSKYFQPSNINISITEKRTIFAMRNRMIDIPDNFKFIYGIEHLYLKCKMCNKDLSQNHIYEFNYLNKEKSSQVDYEKVFEGTVREQFEVTQSFMINLKRYYTPSDLHVIPLFTQ